MDYVSEPFGLNMEDTIYDIVSLEEWRDPLRCLICSYQDLPRKYQVVSCTHILFCIHFGSGLSRLDRLDASKARVWNISDGQCHVVLRGHKAALHSAVFSAG